MWLWLFGFGLALASCGDDGAVPLPDAGGSSDGGVVCTAPALAFARDRVATVPGVDRVVRLRLERDACETFEVWLDTSDPRIATVAPASIAEGRAQTDVTISAIGEGTATVTARISAGYVRMAASIEIVVTHAEVPACEGSASGRLDPGGRIEIATGSLAGSAIALPEGATRPDLYHVDAFDASIACAGDAVPAGYRALGPAVSFSPAELRLLREIPMTIPLRDGLLPQGAHLGHVEIAYSGPGLAEPRIVPVAFTKIEGSGDALLTFEAPRLGAYRAVVREDAGTPAMREIRHRAIVGVSMGGFGTGSVGFRHPELFDVVAPLGAAWDLGYLLAYIHDYHLGGFCTDAERTADPEACLAGSSDRVPAPRHVHEHAQDYEHWFNDERQTGPGASFARGDYLDIFTDLSMMFGNPNTDGSLDGTTPNITAPGVPDSERARSPEERCASPVVIPPFDGTEGTGYFDDEYNPLGAYPVITYCEGSEVSVDGEIDHGVWDPDGENARPLDVGVAVDVNGNGRRDAGEPIVRAGHERFEDCGADRLCGEDEPGYDPIDNRDPAGDDYDYQYNPRGTEGNFVRDGDPCDLAGERFTDFGLDGVRRTAQLDEGGFDLGEGNRCFDLAQGSRAMIATGPRARLVEMGAADLDRIAIFGDGGIRDLFNGAVAANHTFGALAARSRPLRYYNSHAGLALDGSILDDDFDMRAVMWPETGSKVLVRYGDPDTSPELFARGDGAHVGTMAQAVNRMLAALRFVDARWPDGDRSVVRDTLCGAECDNPTQIALDFEASSGRIGPVSIVLPPGYYHERFAETRYPVVYFLHGYGMQPMDLAVTSVLFWAFMTDPMSPEWARLQKTIFVFPDGRCREGECVRGTFWQNAPENTPNRALMDDFVLEVIDHVDSHYRTRGTETRLVVD
jgi:hypothetical protein